jgi:hypothetical protein
MEWTEPRRILKINTYNLITGKSTKPANWNTFRQNCIKKHNHTCCYCGGKYIRYLRCFPLNNDLSEYDISCPLCYYVSNININIDHDTNPFNIYMSSLSQLEINRKTTEFIINNGRNPEPFEIDPKLININISLFEFSNLCLIKNNHTLHTPNTQCIPHTYDEHYKLFINDSFNFNYLDYNLFESSPTPDEGHTLSMTHDDINIYGNIKNIFQIAANTK